MSIYNLSRTVFIRPAFQDLEAPTAQIPSRLPSTVSGDFGTRRPATVVPGRQPRRSTLRHWVQARSSRRRISFPFLSLSRSISDILQFITVAEKYRVFHAPYEDHVIILCWPQLPNMCRVCQSLGSPAALFLLHNRSKPTFYDPVTRQMEGSQKFGMWVHSTRPTEPQSKPQQKVNGCTKAEGRTAAQYGHRGQRRSGV